jgi:integrase
MRANRKELALLRGKRTPETLADWAKYFGEGDREKAQRYALAVATFLGQTPDGEWADYLGQLSPNTRKAYAYAVTEFFEWVAAKYDRVVPPHRVVRKDAEDYVNWLANRPFSLAEEKLKDGDMQLSLQLFEIVKKLGGARVRDIANELPRELSLKYFGKDSASDLDSGNEFERAQYVAGKRELSRDVRQLITLDVLTATPTIEELRRDHPQAGITQWKIGGVHYDDVFTYSVREYKPVSRTTVALRIAALSQFWKILMQGENIAGGQSILQYDIWEGVKKRVNRGISPEKRRAAREQKVPTEVILQMLEKAPNKTLVQLRNRAILYLLVFTGLRTTELLKLRRARPTGSKMPYFDGTEPPALQVLRKGNKWMRLPYPPVALKPLIEFQAELEKRAQEQVDSGEDEKQQLVNLYQLLQLPEAPLFPSIGFWGANTPDDYRKSMSRINLYRLLQRIAEETGVPSELVKKVHPHAIRHFSANAMAAGGKDLREIQHLLGHTSITTTEGYLEDIDEEVKLSGQSEILDFLKAKGVEVRPPEDGRPKKSTQIQPEVIDTYAIDAEFEEVPEDVQAPVLPDNPITIEEVKVLSEIPEDVPSNELPVPPQYDGPETKVVETKKGNVLVDGEDLSLIGVTGDEEPTQDQLREISETMLGGTSPGAPDEVYEALADKDEAETVVFNRGGQKEKDWLIKNYPKMPSDYGLGRQSLLPWYVKAKGNVSRSGFFRGMPPFPLWSYMDQVTPYSARGQNLLSQVEQLYSKFTYGDAVKGTPPSPLQGVGLIKWFGFFSYFATRFHESFANVFEADRPRFVPFDQEVQLGQGIRMHKDEWLISWLEKNSHTYRASVDAMKRGVPRGAPRGKERKRLEKEERDRDPEQYFLKASFEGIDLVKQMPDWMVEDDPIYAMWRDDPEQFEAFSKWLKNVTGQALSRDRERAQDESEENTKDIIAQIRDVLVLFYEARDQLIKEVRRPKGSLGSEEGKMQGTGDSGADDYKMAMRNSLISYFLLASGMKESELELRQPIRRLLKESSVDFQKHMDELFDEAGVPNPNAEKYRGSREIEKRTGSSYKKGEGPQRVKDRITRIVRDLFPGELDDVNVFADSELFDPSWFRVDEENHTIYIEEKAAKELQQKYGIQQSPQLLLRRAARAMWESRQRGYDKLWGVMLSYMSWIVPTGAQMESMARGIELPKGMTESRAARMEWLEDYVKKVSALADGSLLKQAIRKEEKKALPAPEKTRVLRRKKSGVIEEIQTHSIADLGTLQEEMEKKPSKEEEAKPKRPKKPSDVPRKGQSRKEWEQEWARYMEAEDEARRARSGDMLDYAMSLDDYLSFSSVDGMQSAEEMLMEMEGSFDGDFRENRFGGFTKNGKNLYLHMENETPKYWYRVRKFDTPMTPNAGSETFVSPAVLYNTQKKIMPAMTLLPSPFRMMSAMELGQ